MCFRLWHTACSGPDGEVFVFGGCANNLLSHHRAVSSKSYLNQPYFCTYVKRELNFFFFLTGAQQRVTGFQRSAQISSPVSVCRSKDDALQCTPDTEMIWFLFFFPLFCVHFSHHPLQFLHGDRFAAQGAFVQLLGLLA